MEREIGNQQQENRMKKSAFTLVEILIVVIILGILAAIVIPQFTQASNDARTNALASDLQTVRSQLQRYKVQHLDNFPGTTMSSLLTSRTNQAGTVGTDANLFPYGPYLQKFPTNAFAGNNTVATSGSAGTGTAGWWYDAGTGTFCPNDTGHTGM
jgi:general secretion pathway protein G